MLRRLYILFILLGLFNAQAQELIFNTIDRGAPSQSAEILDAWRTVVLDPDYGGHWIVTGDVDGDGEADIVSCKNVDNNDVHFTSAAVAHRLDGTVIWRWGNPNIGRKNWHHDVPCQIYDWDGDGQNEVILLAEGFIVELDGKTGVERRRIPIQKEATDCLIFANLSGTNHASEILVKDRYTQIWAYSVDGKELWTVKNPGDYRTSHQARPVDLDNDGRDEIFAGYAMLNHDGSVRWIFKSETVDQKRGHLDCARILQKGKTPEEFRFALTCCGAKNIACIDGNGQPVWEKTGHHYESIQIGNIVPDAAQPQILVDIDHRPYGRSPLWVMDANGNQLGQLMTDYCRHHRLLDWTGDGYDNIILPDAQGVFDGAGKRIATFNTGSKGMSVLLGDMSGDGYSDVTILTTNPEVVFIFQNYEGKTEGTKSPLGCGVNYTFY
jgi:hypothetical protein